MKARVQFLPVLVFALLIGFTAPSANAADCGGTTDPTFTVELPVVWEADWGAYPVVGMVQPDVITIPNNRPIYALIVHGYSQNYWFDHLLLYNFAKHLMEQGAYVHWSWWNNLCAEYMARPLHLAQPMSRPGEFLLDLGGFAVPQVGYKAMPREDYQFQADAKAFLKAVRENNPNAVIVVAGHSMGGGAISRLASDPEMDVLIDLLAPIDPVGNRDYPYSLGRILTHDYNWTRWRAARPHFKGYMVSECADEACSECVPTWDWLDHFPALWEFYDWPPCGDAYVDDPDPLTFPSTVINLHHRYQMESAFPFDYTSHEPFGHDKPFLGITSQEYVYTTWAFWEITQGLMGMLGDGHGQIVGYYGLDPRGLRMLLFNPNYGRWISDPAFRRTQLIQMGSTSYSGGCAPWMPNLCLVSDSLITRFDTMNKWPVANAGPNQVVACTQPYVTLDGSASYDDDEDKGDVLTYTWRGSFGELTGPIVDVMLDGGVHDITLSVKDQVGHVDCDVVQVVVRDDEPPELAVTLAPGSLWPPNHKMVDVEALIDVSNVCGGVTTVRLVSVTSSDPDDGRGDGHTTGDIRGAEIGTYDRFFQLRAERSGGGEPRVYTITYQAVDGSGNETTTSAEIRVANMPPGAPRTFRVAYASGSGNRLSWDRCPDPDFEHFKIYRSTDPEFLPTPSELVFTTSELQWADPQYDTPDVFYRISAMDDCGQESPASAPVTQYGNSGEPILITLNGVSFDFMSVGDEDRPLAMAMIPGTEALDVGEIDATSLSLFEETPVAWRHENVTIPLNGPDDECGGLSKGFDGYKDLCVMFDRDAIVTMLAQQTAAMNLDDDPAAAPESGEDREEFRQVMLMVSGKLTDGTQLEAYGCLEFSLSELDEPRPREDSALPRAFALGANVPNPFNPSTRISFALPHASQVNLEVFDLAGRHVNTLVSEVVSAGEHQVQWNGKDASGSDVASGVYLYHLRASDFVETKRMVLLR